MHGKPLYNLHATFCFLYPHAHADRGGGDYGSKKHFMQSRKKRNKSHAIEKQEE